MTTITVNSPIPVTEPRGSVWAAQAASAILGFLGHTGQALRAGTRQASSKSRVREATHVRRLADSLREQDPRFAADLYAAADRHEQV